MINYRLFLGLTQADGLPVPAARVETCRLAVAAVWQAHTVYEAAGVWQGQAEACLVFEHYGSADEAAQARSLAGVLARLAAQACVGLASSPASFDLIEPKEHSK